MAKKPALIDVQSVKTGAYLAVNPECTETLDHSVRAYHRARYNGDRWVDQRADQLGKPVRR